MIAQVQRKLARITIVSSTVDLLLGVSFVPRLGV